MKKLYLDDMRQPPDTTWDVARSTSEAIDYIMLNGCPPYISLDYCLSGGATVMPFINWLIEEDRRQKGALIPMGFAFDSHSSALDGKALTERVLGDYLKSRF